MAAIRMNGGKCKTLATFARLAVVAGDFDDNEDQWEQVCEAYVHLQPLTGTELVEAQQINERVNYKVTMRHSAKTSSLSSGDRMTVGDRMFQLSSVVNVDSRGHWIEATAIESK